MSRVPKLCPDHDEFVSKLEEILEDVSPGELLAIPGVYELLSEHFNNDVLEAFAEDEDENDVPQVFPDEPAPEVPPKGAGWATVQKFRLKRRSG
jgi:hypothetical protein